MTLSAFHHEEHKRASKSCGDAAGLHIGAHVQQLNDQPAVREPAPVSTSMAWHVLLAQLIASLRGCLNAAEREEFDMVHAKTHARQIKLGEFFAFALETIRKRAPHMEPSYREIFRLRNASRRQAQQKLVDRQRAGHGQRMRASMSMPDLQHATLRRQVSEDCMEDTLGRLAGLRVGRYAPDELEEESSVDSSSGPSSPGSSCVSLAGSFQVRPQAFNGNYARKRSSEDLLSVADKTDGQDRLYHATEEWMKRDLKPRLPAPLHERH
jgi:hypothetical protein